MTYSSFNPGKPWLDTEGKPIHAHGGSIITVNGVYYWYGENKEKSTAGSGIWHWGVRCYSSTDLYNWKDLGIICPPNETDGDHPLHFTQYMDRPHIVYNEKTCKFVLWMKIMDKKSIIHQYMTICTADKITGPYENLKTWEPDGFCSGDFDIVKDPKSGKAYIYFDALYGCSHKHIACFQLNDDYTAVVGEPTFHMSHPERFVGREAPCFFERNGKKFMTVSQTTGYIPNPTECFESDDYHGEWKNLGRIHINDTELLSFRSQISSVFKIPDKDIYIAVADRWLPNLQPDMPLNWVDIYDNAMNPESDGSLKPLFEEINNRNNYPPTRDTSIARYVWLPIEFDENNKPSIKWYDSWKWEDFE